MDSFYRITHRQCPPLTLTPLTPREVGLDPELAGHLPEVWGKSLSPGHGEKLRG